MVTTVALTLQTDYSNGSVQTLQIAIRTSYHSRDQNRWHDVSPFWKSKKAWKKYWQNMDDIANIASQLGINF